MKFEEFEALAPQTIYVSATPGAYELDKSGGEVVDQGGAADRSALTQSSKCARWRLRSTICCQRIRLRTAINERVLVTTLTKRMGGGLNRVP